MSTGSRRYEFAPVAPIPADPGQCRWCGGTRKVLHGHDYCATGCTPNDQAAHECRCADCGRVFMSGKFGAEQCHPCETRQRGVYQRSYQETYLGAPKGWLARRLEQREQGK